MLVHAVHPVISVPIKLPICTDTLLGLTALSMHEHD